MTLNWSEDKGIRTEEQDEGRAVEPAEGSEGWAGASPSS